MILSGTLWTGFVKWIAYSSRDEKVKRKREFANIYIYSKLLIFDTLRVRKTSFDGYKTYTYRSTAQAANSHTPTFSAVESPVQFGRVLGDPSLMWYLFYFTSNQPGSWFSLLVTNVSALVWKMM